MKYDNFNLAKRTLEMHRLVFKLFLHIKCAGVYHVYNQEDFGFINDWRKTE